MKKNYLKIFLTELNFGEQISIATLIAVAFLVVYHAFI